jgi:hypothetical protein
MILEKESILFAGSMRLRRADKMVDFLHLLGFRWVW